MTIARLDLWNSLCPPTLDNTTLDFNYFNYSTPTDQNLTLFYNCTSRVRGLDRANFPYPLGGVGATGNTTKRRDCHYRTSPIGYWDKGSTVCWYKLLRFFYL